MPDYTYGSTAQRKALISKDVLIDENAPNTNQVALQSLRTQGGSGTSIRKRSIIEITLPANPRPQSDITLNKIHMYLYGASISANSPIIECFRMSQTSWVEAQATWNDYKTAVAWTAAGGDYDSVKDWSGKGAGIIDEVYVNATLQYYMWDLTPLIGPLGLTWGDSFSVIIRNSDEAAINDEVILKSSRYGSDEIYVDVIYENAAPSPATIRPEWDRAAQKVRYRIEVPSEDIDFTQAFMRRDTTSGVQFGDGDAVLVDFGAQEGVNDVTDRAVGSVIENYDGAYTEPAQNTPYYVAAFSEDADNIDGAATPSNEASYIRPQMSTNGVDNDFMITNAAGEEAANLDVREEVFLIVTPKQSVISALDDIKSVYIDWGDGGKADYEYWARNPSVNPGAAASITFGDASGLAVGDYIAASEDVGGWENEVRKIATLTDTVATLDSAFTVAFTTSAVITRTRRHRYTATGSKTATCQVMNKGGFQSQLQSITTAPDLQALSPVAVIDAQKLVARISEEFVLSGLRSKSLNTDLVIVWNNGTGANKSYWKENSGSGTATFSDSDGAVTTVSMDEADDYVLELQVADDDGTPNTDTETVTITIEGDVFFCYQPRILVDNAGVGTGNTVTIDGAVYTVVAAAPGANEFLKGAASIDTATNLNAAINANLPPPVQIAFRKANVISLVGAAQSVTTDTPAGFLVKDRTGTIELEKSQQIGVDIQPHLGTTGFTRTVLTNGDKIYKLRGFVFKVEDREALERLNDGSTDFVAMHVDGDIRALYPLSKGAIIIEKKTRIVPPDQSSGSTTGTWEWQGQFIEDSAKAWATSDENSDEDLMEIAAAP